VAEHHRAVVIEMLAQRDPGRRIMKELGERIALDPSCSPSSKIVAPNSENVGSQLLSLRQRSLRIRSPLGLGSRQKPNNGGLFLLGLWTGMPPRVEQTRSPRPIFSEPLDSAVLVQRFEPAPDKDFFRWPGPEVGISFPGARATWLELHPRCVASGERALVPNYKGHRRSCA
jgi:hypothetical protein